MSRSLSTMLTMASLSIGAPASSHLEAESRSSDPVGDVLSRAVLPDGATHRLPYANCPIPEDLAPYADDYPVAVYNQFVRRGAKLQPQSIDVCAISFGEILSRQVSIGKQVSELIRSFDSVTAQLVAVSDDMTPDPTALHRAKGELARITGQLTGLLNTAGASVAFDNRCKELMKNGEWRALQSEIHCKVAESFPDGLGQVDRQLSANVSLSDLLKSAAYILDQNASEITRGSFFADLADELEREFPGMFSGRIRTILVAGSSAERRQLIEGMREFLLNKDRPESK